MQHKFQKTYYKREKYANKKGNPINKKYNILSELIMPCFIMSFAIVFLWFALVFINSFLLQGKDDIGYTWGLNTMIVFWIFYLFFFGYSSIGVRFGTMGRKWKAIIHKLAINQHHMDFVQEVGYANTLTALGNLSDNNGLRIAGAMESADVAASMAGSLHFHVQEVAQQCQIKISAKKYVVGIIFLPSFLLIATFVPSIVQSIQNLEHKVETITSTMEELTTLFEEEDYATLFDSPWNDYSTYEFSALYCKDLLKTANTESIVSIPEHSLSLRISPDGTIKEIRYHIDVNLNCTQEENIQNIHAIIEKTTAILQNSPWAESVHNLLDSSDVLDTFTTEYLRGDGQKDIHIYSNETSPSFHFAYTVEDNSEPYFYYKIKE